MFNIFIIHSQNTNVRHYVVQNQRANYPQVYLHTNIYPQFISYKYHEG